MALVDTPLIVEDGSIVTGADTFVSVADAAQYLYDRGLITSESAITAGLLRRGLDALLALSCLAAYRLPLASVTDIPPEKPFCVSPLSATRSTISSYARRAAMASSACRFMPSICA